MFAPVLIALLVEVVVVTLVVAGVFLKVAFADPPQNPPRVEELPARTKAAKPELELVGSHQ